MAQNDQRDEGDARKSDLTQSCRTYQDIFDLLAAFPYREVDCAATRGYAGSEQALRARQAYSDLGSRLVSARTSGLFRSTKERLPNPRFHPEYAALVASLDEFLEASRAYAESRRPVKRPSEDA